MRKMKKINGYLVVKFNARELREYEGTALGEYGVIDAELYTGILDVDRGAMEYDNAGSMEEAVELARGLESEDRSRAPTIRTWTSARQRMSFTATRSPSATWAFWIGKTATSSRTPSGRPRGRSPRSRRSSSPMCATSFVGTAARR